MKTKSFIFWTLFLLIFIFTISTVSGDMKTKKIDKSPISTSDYQANNTYLDVTFGERSSSTWEYQYSPDQWSNACYKERYGAWTENWNETKESDSSYDFTVDLYFTDSTNGRTAILHHENLQITRQIYVPSGDTKQFTITYTLANNGTSSLTDVRFFQIVDYDIGGRLNDYGWYVTATDAVWQNDDNYFRNGFSGSRTSSNHGMEEYSTEQADWDDGELNGNDKYPESGTDDVAVGMQWNVGTLSAGESWDLVVTFYFGGVAGITADAGPDRTVGRGESVTFDASFSESVGTITTYEWDFDNDGTYDVSTGSPTYVYAGWNESGTYTVGLRVTDDGGRNDTDIVTITIIPSVDLTISDITYSPASGVNAGDAVTLNATIRNVGAEDLGESYYFYVVFYVDGSWVGSSYVYGISTGESKTVTQTWIATPGSNHSVRVVLDYYADITETNESNNERTESLPYSILYPDLTVTDIIWSPTEGVDPGDTVTFTATIDPMFVSQRLKQ